MNVDVVQSVASFEMIQHYINVNDKPIETLFLFPVNDKIAFSQITIDFEL